MANRNNIKEQCKQNEAEAKKYYTEEFPSGPWSRALYQMRTGKPFDEEEFKKSYAEDRKKIRELMESDMKQWWTR
jgi:hypothetical protein